MTVHPDRHGVLARWLDDPLTGANCALCGATADNFHVPDELWERVGLGDVQACFKCFRIAAWHAGVRPEPYWEILPASRRGLSQEQVLAVMQLATVPIAKMLLAIAYYSMTADSRIAEAVWE